MKLPCDIVQDLLPLYEDGLCSQTTREAVEEHLRECETCGKEHEAVQELAEPEVVVEPKQEEKATAKSFRKIRNRWIASIVIILLLIPIGYLGWGQYSLSGPSFTNLRELYIANRFAQCLANGDYEGAFGYVDVEGVKERWLQDGYFTEEKMENFEEDAWDFYQQLAADVEESGGIQNIRYVGIGGYGMLQDGEDEYQVDFRMTYEDREVEVILWVTDGGVTSGHASYPIDHPLEKLLAWSYPMYDKYRGYRYDSDLGYMVPYED